MRNIAKQEVSEQVFELKKDLEKLEVKGVRMNGVK